MTNRTIYIIGGLVFGFLALIGLRFKIDSYYVQQHGDLITVKVLYVPNCIGTKIKYHFRFQYLENRVIKEYSKQIGGGLCDKHTVDQDLKLKADLGKKIFLYENEDVRVEFVSMGLLGLGSILCFIFGFKKNNFTHTVHISNGGAYRLSKGSISIVISSSWDNLL